MSEWPSSAENLGPYEPYVRKVEAERDQLRRLSKLQDKVLAAYRTGIPPTDAVLDEIRELRRALDHTEAPTMSYQGLAMKLDAQNRAMRVRIQELESEKWKVEAERDELRAALQKHHGIRVTMHQAECSVCRALAGSTQVHRKGHGTKPTGGTRVQMKPLTTSTQESNDE